MAIRSAFSPFGGQHEPYKKGELIIELTKGSIIHNLALAKGVYSLEVIGAGGGYGGSATPDGHYWGYTGTGASGAGFVGIIEVGKGIYNLKAGFGGADATVQWIRGINGEASFFKDSQGLGIIAGGGDAATSENNAWNNGWGHAGVLGITASKIIKSAMLSKNGNDGPSFWSWASKGTGATSVYKNYGEGSVRPSDGVAKGGDGYLRLIYLGQKYISGKTEALAEQFRT